MSRIPHGWRERQLGEVCERVTVGIATSVTEHYRDSGIPMLRNQNVLRGRVDDTDLVLISEEFARQNAAKAIRKGDVLTVRTGANVGCTAVVPDKYEKAQTFTTLITTTKRSELLPEYLSFHINSHFGQVQVAQLGGNGGLGNLNAGALAQYLIPIPPLREQKVIAGILAFWDAVVARLELLVEAKSKRKRGLMQRLLTGKTRFKEFIGEPRPTRLGVHVREVVEVNKAQAVLHVLSVTNSCGFVAQAEHFSKRVASDALNAYRIVRRGQFAFNPSRVNVGSIARLLDCEAGVLSPMYEVFEVEEQTLSGDFMNQLIQSHSFQQQLKSFLQGSVRQSLSFDGLASMRFWIPSLVEQKRIADVLGVCDCEIHLLEKELAALKEQKRGLMQKLLTGELRVKV